VQIFKSDLTKLRETPAISNLREKLNDVPLLAYLLSALAGVGLERVAGINIARFFGLRNLPELFGTLDVLDHFGNLDLSGILAPLMPSNEIVAPWTESWSALVNVLGTLLKDIPPALLSLVQVTAYNLMVFVIPTILLGLLLKRPISWLLKRIPLWVSLLVQLGVLYMIVRLWGGENAYRDLVLTFIGINVILAASLNLINGYMGEFSVGHGGFMAVGAYVSAIMTMWLFIDDSLFGPPLLQFILTVPLGIGQAIGFIFALALGGLASAVVSLLVAIPSFRTRGDYLAIVTLALNFIVLAVLNNIDAIGGARGLNGVPLWTTTSWVFAITVLSLFSIRNLVTSTFGKGIIAIREDEIAADLMSVNTRQVKLTAFLFSSFLAGVAGGLFGHVLAYVNPGTFGILKSTEALVMVYLGGMGSLTGSIVAAVIFTILLEALRPLGVLKWVFIPLILILMMLYRPQGLFGDREIILNLGINRNQDADKTTSRKDPDVAVTD